MFNIKKRNNVLSCHICLAVPDFREYNYFFANLCSLISYTSESLTGKSLSKIAFTDNDVGKIIKSLDPNKAHGHV